MTAPSRVQPTAWGVVRHFWRVADGRPWHIAAPLGLVLLANLFDVASLSLIIPLADAVADNSFGFLESSRAFGWIPDLVPSDVAEGEFGEAAILGVIACLIFVARLAKFVAEYAANLFVVKRSEAYRVAISRETFGRVLGFGRQYFDRQALGRIDTEIGWSNAVLRLLAATEGLFRHVVAILAKLAVMFAISIPLVITFAFALPAVQWIVAGINRRVRRIAHEGVEIDRRLRGQMLDILGSVPLVKGYSHEARAEAEYESVLREAEVVAVRRQKVLALRYPIEEIAVLLLLFGAQAAVIVWTGEFQPNDIAIFAAFIVVLQQSLRDYKKVSRYTLTVSEELPRLEAVAGLFSDEGKHTVESGDRAFDGFDDEIRISDLDFAYRPSEPVLRSVNASIPAGRVTAIVGPSGAGKTTLVDLIARFYDCAPGSIFVDGVDIRDFALPTLHRRMAIVSQDVRLLNRTLRQNLCFGLERDPSDDELRRALSDVDLVDLLDSLPEGLETVVGDRGVRLSGGQRQRVALARALLRDPDVLILDEATSALDSRVEKRVAQAIQDRVEGHTLLVIAHRLSTIRDADQILVMEDGRITESGSWDELVRLDGTFASLLRAQFDEDPELAREADGPSPPVRSAAAEPTGGE